MIARCLFPEPKILPSFREIESADRYEYAPPASSVLDSAQSVSGVTSRTTTAEAQRKIAKNF
jgi:hypothetical protein